MKRILCLFCSLLVCLSLSGCSILTILLRESTELPNPEDLYTYEEDLTSYGYYYDQLSEESKAVYRTIYKNPTSEEGVEIILPTTLSLTIVEGEDDESVQGRITERVIGITQPAIDALLYDHPAFFYVRMGGEDSSSFSIIHRREKQKEGGATVYMRKLIFYLRTENILPTRTLSEEIANLQTAIEHFTVEGESRYERLLSIHRGLAAAVVYDAEGVRPHCSAGALIDGRAVCDGYAKAFKLLCDREGIPCVILAGVANQNGKSEPHAWNYVQMEDGLWYAVDTTWDDLGHTAGRQYFLVGSTESEFLETHVPSGKFSEGDHDPFTAPVLAEKSYTPA
ncbi:MAG: hypothetical protein IJ009_06685 [Clostridia bacterium]|nr:hypothetical protein [Clostridia bacterium]